MRLFLLVFITLTAFAANSVLTRLALKGDVNALTSSPVSFTIARLVFGAIMLLILFRPKLDLLKGSWWQAITLRRS